MATAIWDSKKYNRINWKNLPATSTALGATNLNKIDVFCNDVDNALVQMDAGKLNVSTANSMLASVSFNQDTGTFTFKELSGTTYTYDLNLEKIPVSFTLTEDGILIMTTEDGTQWQCNIADLIKDYVFDDSDTIAFEKEFVSTDDEGKGSYHVSASVKAGSINENHLDPDYRADILDYKNTAQTAANDSLSYAKTSKRWAVGDSEFEGSATDNSKYYKEQAEAAKAAAEQARDEAQAATGAVVATVDHVGVVKPDGVTISIEEDGTIHGPQKFDSDGYVYVDDSETGIEPPADPTLDADELGGVPPEGYVKKASDLYTGTDYTVSGEKAADATAIKTLNDKFSDSNNIGAVDTYGILVSALGQSNVQALIDELANRVMNQLIARNAMSSSQVNDANKVPTSSLVYSMNQQIEELNGELFLKSEQRRMIYRGSNLGSTVTEEQKGNIKNGTFEGFFLGDYWSIGGYTWRIVDFNYWYNCGDTAFTSPHLVIMPDKPLYDAQMNETNITTGGYTGSLMYTENLAQAKTLAASAFGDLILTHREYLTNAVTDGHASAGTWFDSTLDLPNEIMMYGCHVCAAMNNGTVIPTNYTIGKTQLALFTVVPKLISNRATFWLRDVVSSAYFASVNNYGSTRYNNASNSHGVRPVFAIG